VWYEPVVPTDEEIRVDDVSWAELVEIAASAVRRADLGGRHGGALVVRDAPTRLSGLVEAGLVEAGFFEAVHRLPVVVVLDGPVDAVPFPAAVADAADVIAAGDDLERVIARVVAGPQAATALAVLLRGGQRRSVFEGLAAESAVYSTLQGGDEFRVWRAAHPRRDRPPPSGPSVRVTTDGATLDVVLTRPEVRNALDARLRDELWDALLVAASDPELTVRWSAEGPSFCSGGDLDEFGSVPDPATGHLVRLSRSLGLALHELADRTTVHVHGASAGSGIELPAFAGRVVARPDATFSLPELQLGLIPGAGGTVSLPRRIGRHRTAWLALTGSTIDAGTALRWGLVDEIRAD
jgi:hypothetical protein